jgi:hypothetical protein
MSKKTSFYLYSADHPNGFMFSETSERRAELEASGEWFDHPNKVPGRTIDGNEQASGAEREHQVLTSTNTVRNEQGATGEPRYTLAEILHSSTSMFSLDQLMGEAAKHDVILARNSEDSTLEAVVLEVVKPLDQPNPPATPPVKRPTSVVYDNEAVAAMIQSGNTDPLNHGHLVALAKLLGVKHHKVRQPDLLAALKAALASPQPPQRDGTERDRQELAEAESQADGTHVPPLKPKTD